MSPRNATAVTVAAIAAALILSSFNNTTAQVQDNPIANITGSSPTQVLQGSFRVTFDTGVGIMRNDRIRRIEFHEQYIVLMNIDNGGQIVPVSSLRQFTWEPG